MSSDIPVSTIKAQPLVITPTHADNTIMDDVVMTMNGTALMGGPVVTTTNIKSSVKETKITTILPRSS